MSSQYTGKKTDFYLASNEVVNLVNLALDLRRPLLVEGEPGCGKTMLAYSIAAELGLKEPTKISVKSTSRAQDLLYRVNVLRRLQEAQRHDNERAKYVYPYLSLGPLGQAIHEKERCVVLIDEIDKADIDFPNDLLDVLDRFTFQIEDLPYEEEKQCIDELGFGRKVTSTPGSYPIVIITSNREKRLPEPFLRRCLYVCLKFPATPEELNEIVKKNLRTTADDLNEMLCKMAVDTFRNVRAIAVGHTQKPPSTSELIDWVRILHWQGETAESLATGQDLPPQWQVLFKTMDDLEAYEALARQKAPTQ